MMLVGLRRFRDMIAQQQILKHLCLSTGAATTLTVTSGFVRPIADGLALTIPHAPPLPQSAPAR